LYIIVAALLPLHRYSRLTARFYPVQYNSEPLLSLHHPVRNNVPGVCIVAIDRDLARQEPDRSLVRLLPTTRRTALALSSCLCRFGVPVRHLMVCCSRQGFILIVAPIDRDARHHATLPFHTFTHLRLAPSRLHSAFPAGPRPDIVRESGLEIARHEQRFFIHVSPAAHLLSHLSTYH
jgi:hypothetical protein